MAKGYGAKSLALLAKYSYKGHNRLIFSEIRIYIIEELEPTTTKAIAMLHGVVFSILHRN